MISKSGFSKRLFLLNLFFIALFSFGNKSSEVDYGSFLSTIPRPTSQSLVFSQDIRATYYYTKPPTPTDSEILIETDINKFTFEDANGNYLYGYDPLSKTIVTPAPSNFKFLIKPPTPTGRSIIISGNPISPNLFGTVNDTKIFYKGPSDRTITINGSIIDTNQSNVEILSGLSLNYRVLPNFTIALNAFSACEYSQIFTVNEATEGLNNYICRPYTIEVYDLGYKNLIHTQTITDTNSFSLEVGDGKDLPGPGNYSFTISNACGQVIPQDQDDPFAVFSIQPAYSFGADLNFAGFKCIDDTESEVDIVLNSVIPPVTWTVINNSSNETELTNDDTDRYINYGPFETFNSTSYSIVIKGLPVGSFTFNFTDKLGCTQSLPFTVTKPVRDIVETLVSKTDVTCPSDNDGSIVFDVSGGWYDNFPGNTDGAV